MTIEWTAVKDATPTEDGLYLVCARSADDDCPFRHLAFWHDGEFHGLVSIWIKQISHWIPFPKTPFPECPK